MAVKSALPGEKKVAIKLLNVFKQLGYSDEKE